ncbi:MAG TPA: DUF1570 domain-containing protein [Tepidisphaeraceae bacterium]|nr:DUF1570 domain-containing protein [Tepidisphaeraceae bacterium]
MSLFPTVFFLVGCATEPPRLSPDWRGPSSAATISVEPWKFEGATAECVVTPHYRIYTTVHDPVLLDQVGQLMEGALPQYAALGGGIKSGQKPMVCYLFANRPQWADETRQSAGPNAPIYLQVNRGGYTYKDVYVAFFLGEAGTYSVTAHEGFHQYVDRNLQDRTLPFMEEGLACMFEQVKWEDGLPRWNLRVNDGRLNALREAVQYKQLWTVRELMEMHAGMIVNQPAGRISAFYAECWAFAQWMWEGDGGAHRPALRQMLADSAKGKLWGNGFSRDAQGPRWNPKTLQPILEHYLGVKLDDIQKSFDAYVKQRCEEE